MARTLYVDEELGLDLTNTVYALASTTIALCLSVFPWAHFKAAVKMHTLLDLRGNIPSFIHISDGKLHEFMPRYALAGSRSSRGSVARLYVLHQAGAFFVTRAKEHRCSSRLFGADGSLALDGPVRITPNFCGEGPRVRRDCGSIKQHLRIKQRQFYSTSCGRYTLLQIL